MSSYCSRQGIHMQPVRFLFDFMRIGPNRTPQALEMEDGDIIDVLVEQQGDQAVQV